MTDAKSVHARRHVAGVSNRGAAPEPPFGKIVRYYRTHLALAVRATGTRRVRLSPCRLRLYKPHSRTPARIGRVVEDKDNAPEAISQEKPTDIDQGRSVGTSQAGLRPPAAPVSRKVARSHESPRGESPSTRHSLPDAALSQLQTAVERCHASSTYDEAARRVLPAVKAASYVALAACGADTSRIGIADWAIDTATRRLIRIVEGYPRDVDTETLIEHHGISDVIGSLVNVATGLSYYKAKVLRAIDSDGNPIRLDFVAKPEDPDLLSSPLQLNLTWELESHLRFEGRSDADAAEIARIVARSLGPPRALESPGQIAEAVELGLALAQAFADKARDQSLAQPEEASTRLEELPESSRVDALSIPEGEITPYLGKKKSGPIAEFLRAAYPYRPSSPRLSLQSLGQIDPRAYRAIYNQLDQRARDKIGLPKSSLEGDSFLASMGIDLTSEEGFNKAKKLWSLLQARLYPRKRQSHPRPK